MKSTATIWALLCLVTSLLASGDKLTFRPGRSNPNPEQYLSLPNGTHPTSTDELIVDTGWVRRYNGPANGADRAAAIALHGDTCYVTGRGANGYDNAITIKYKPNGDTCWLRRYYGMKNTTGNAIAVDELGNVYIAGRTNFRFMALKYTPQGAVAWAKDWGTGDHANAVVYADGAVYVTGRGWDGSYGVFYTACINPATGDLVWENRLDLSADEEARSLAVGSGSVYVAGTVGYGTGGQDSSKFLTQAINSDGSTRWYRTFGIGRDSAKAIVLGTGGPIAPCTASVYVTGKSCGLLNVDCVTVRYKASTGDMMDTARYDSGQDDWGNAILRCTDDVMHEHFYVAGTAGGDYLVIQYSSDLHQVAIARYGGRGYDEAVAIAAANNFVPGIVYVTGFAEDMGPAGGLNYLTIAYDEYLQRMWVHGYDGPARCDDKATALAANVWGSVWVTGASMGVNTGWDYATIRYYARDVGCTRIVRPIGSVAQGAVIVPACSTYNYATQSTSYRIRMQIGSSYDRTVTVSGHLPKTYRYVTFPNWTAGGPWKQVVKCSVQFTRDERPENDMKKGQVLIGFEPCTLATRSKSISGSNTDLSSTWLQMSGVRMTTNQSQCRLEIHWNPGTNLKVEVFSVTGGLVCRQRSATGYLDINGLGSGIYVVRLRTATSVEDKKIQVL